MPASMTSDDEEAAPGTKGGTATAFAGTFAKAPGNGTEPGGGGGGAASVAD